MHKVKVVAPMVRCAVTAVALTLLMAPLRSESALSAQSPVVAVDERIRLRAPSVMGGRWTGTVVSVRGDSVAVRGSSGEIRVVPLPSITHLERSRGSSRGAGALKGALWGTGIGLGLALANAGFSDNTCEPGVGDCVSTATGVLLWSALGLSVGTVIGAVRGSERWERVPIGVAMTRRGSPAIAVSLTW